MSNNPQVTVIIVTYNRLNSLKTCLKALRNQTLSKDKYEVVIVDDGSTDGTKQYLNSLDWQDRPSARCYFEKHSGLVAARNFGAAKARGVFISFTDDDCVPEHAWLEKVLETFSTDDSIGLVGSVTKPVFNNNFLRPLNNTNKKNNSSSVKPEISILENEQGLIGVRPFSGCNLHINRKVFNKLGKFDENIQPSEDIDFLYRYLNYGGKAANRLDLLVEHYERDDFRSIFQRWFSFGRSDPKMVRKYMKGNLSFEIDLFHGLLNYYFERVPFPMTIYLQLNLLKLILGIVFLTILVPKIGFIILTIFIGSFFVRQKNPKMTFSYLVYSIYSQGSYTLGTLVSAIRNRVIFF
ncbi:glycosyltransferase [candidate division KSB1 bacterium]|nr:glycosyltransferase [candidate division KSB1 bacterium]